MKKDFTIAARPFRAAQLCQSDDPTRANIGGVHLATNGDIVGTDGHTLYLHRDSIREGIADVKGFTIKLDRIISKRAHMVRFTIEDTGRVLNVIAKSISKTGKTINTVAGYLIGIDYPQNYMLPIPHHTQTKNEGLPRISFNMRYLGRAGEIFAEGIATMHFGHDELIPVVITDGGVYDEKTKELYLVMPCRIW